MNYSFPTTATLPISKAWGVVDARMYPAPTHRHTGLDIFGITGSPIYAAADGVVKDIMINEHGYGRSVLLQHDPSTAPSANDGSAQDEFETLYAHLLEDIRVRVGDPVTAGQQIGRMGGDPRDNDPIDGVSSNSHLHFEFIYPNQPAGDFVQHWGGYTVDPLNELARLKHGEPKSFATVKAPKGVYVHPEPKVDSPRIGDGLLNKKTVPILDLVEVGRDVWALLWSVRDEYAAVKHQGETLMSVTAGTVVVNPLPPALDEKAIRLDEVNRMITFLEARKKELQ